MQSLKQIHAWAQMLVALGIVYTDIISNFYKNTKFQNKSPQAGNQAEARRPGLQHHMGIDTRNPVFS